MRARIAKLILLLCLFTAAFARADECSDYLSKVQDPLSYTNTPEQLAEYLNRLMELPFWNDFPKERLEALAKLENPFRIEATTSEEVAIEKGLLAFDAKAAESGAGEQMRALARKSLIAKTGERNKAQEALHEVKESKAVKNPTRTTPLISSMLQKNELKGITFFTFVDKNYHMEGLCFDQPNYVLNATNMNKSRALKTLNASSGMGSPNIQNSIRRIARLSKARASLYIVGNHMRANIYKPTNSMLLIFQLFWGRFSEEKWKWYQQGELIKLNKYLSIIDFAASPGAELVATLVDAEFRFEGGAHRRQLQFSNTVNPAHFAPSTFPVSMIDVAVDAKLVSMSPDRKYAAVAFDSGKIGIVQIPASTDGPIEWSPIREFQSPVSELRDLMFIPGSTDMLVYSNQEVWKIDVNGKATKLHTAPAKIQIVSVSSKPGIALVLVDGFGVNLISTRDGSLITQIINTNEISHLGSSWTDAVFSPDGKRILTAEKSGVRIWDLKGNELKEIP